MSKRHAVQLVLIAALALPVAAFAEADLASARVHEPTIDEVYHAAEGGRLSDADAMMARVLSAHPQSAKAHFVHAELLAKEGRLAAARSEYVRADALEPGLPFAKPGAVESLRRTFDGVDGSTGATPMSRRFTATPAAATSAPSSTGMPVKIGLLLLLAMAAYLIFGRRRGFAAPSSPATATANAPAHAPAYPPTYAPVPAYASSPGTPSMPAAAAPVGGGLGSALMSGAAMGLGAVAVQQAVNYFSHHEGPVAPAPAAVQADRPAFANNLGPDTPDDLGGNDFGIADAGSWDDGAGDAGDAGDDLRDSDNGW